MKKLTNASLLKTGSGRTTVCETVIVPNSEETKIIVEPVSLDEYKRTIMEFCKWIEGKAAEFSEEEKRVIKNMSEIPLTKNSSKEVKEYLDELTSDYQEYLFNEIKYEKRSSVEFDFDDCNSNFKSWLKATFKEINDGKNKLCPIPKKITIQIKSDDLNISIPSWIQSVVDTRGIDGGERSDIQSYLVKHDSISLMCDEVHGFGGNESLTSILKQNLLKENRDTKHRTVLLGLERNEELNEITDFEDDREGGIKSKINEACSKFVDNNIGFKSENVFFVNTAPGVIAVDSKIFNVDTDKRLNEIKKFYTSLEQVVVSMYKTYSEEVYDYLRTLTQLSVGKISTETVNKFEKCKEHIYRQEESLTLSGRKILSRFEDVTMEVYHSSLRGAVNHNGVGRTADLYASYQKCGGEEFSSICEIPKSNIATLIDETFRDCNEMESICHQSIIDEINDTYMKYYNESRLSHHKITFRSLFNDDSWKTPRTYWGDKKGDYNYRVTKDIIKEMQNKRIPQELASLQYTSHFFRSIYNYLEIQ